MGGNPSSLKRVRRRRPQRTSNTTIGKTSGCVDRHESTSDRHSARCELDFELKARSVCPASWNEERGAMSNNKIAGAYDVSPAAGYAGDVAPSTAWKILSENKDAVLVDVRTRAEWNYVGLPELASVGKKPALLEWQVFPSMQANPEFVSTLESAIADKDTPLLFLCRSGVRSAAAARAMTAAGYSTCLNVTDGFEGPMDAQGKRGSAAGWKASGLPWRQS